MEDMGGTPWAVAFSEPRDCAIVQQLDPFDRSVDSIAIADGETREALILLISWRYLLPGLLLKAFEPLMKVSDGLGILFHIPVVDSVPLLDGLDKGRGELAESDRVADVKALNKVSRGSRGDGVDVRVVEVGDRHEDGG